MEKPKKYVPGAERVETKKYAKKRMYDTVEWSSYRTQFLAVNPKCYACGERARVVDHVLAHKESEDLFWKQENYIPLCQRCHGYVSNKYEKQSPPDLKGKLEWLHFKRLQTNTLVRVKILPIKPK